MQDENTIALDKRGGRLTIAGQLTQVQVGQEARQIQTAALYDLLCRSGFEPDSNGGVVLIGYCVVMLIGVACGLGLGAWLF